MPPERFLILKTSFMKKNVEYLRKVKKCKKHFQIQNVLKKYSLRSRSFNLDLWY